MKRIAMLFPYAPSYRESIYKLMDKEFNVDWYFCGNAHRNLKFMDYRILKRVDLSMSEKTICGPITYYEGIKALNLQDYDIIICAGVIRNLSEWWLLQRFGNGLFRPKIYVWTHGWYGKESVIQKLVKKLFFRKVDGFLLYGEYAKKEMIKSGFPEDKLFVIKNSLDYYKQLSYRQKIVQSSIYKEHFGNQYPTLIFIGRLTPVKQLDKLIDSLLILRFQNEIYNLVIVGDGEKRKDIEHKVNSLGLSSWVWFYGECYDEKTNAELIYNSDLCISPGNIGLTAMHVLMFGCPAISHNDFKWQMPEFESIHPGKTGDFYEYNDTKDLAVKISQWFKRNGNSRDLIRQNCHEEIDNFWTPDHQLNLLKQIVYQDECNC